MSHSTRCRPDEPDHQSSQCCDVEPKSCREMRTRARCAAWASGPSGSPSAVMSSGTASTSRSSPSAMAERRRTTAGERASRNAVRSVPPTTANSPKRRCARSTSSATGCIASSSPSTKLLSRGSADGCASSCRHSSAQYRRSASSLSRASRRNGTAACRNISTRRSSGPAASSEGTRASDAARFRVCGPGKCLKITTSARSPMPSSVAAVRSPRIPVRAVSPTRRSASPSARTAADGRVSTGGRVPPSDDGRRRATPASTADRSAAARASRSGPAGRWVRIVGGIVPLRGSATGTWLARFFSTMSRANAAAQSSAKSDSPRSTSDEIASPPRSAQSSRATRPRSTTGATAASRSPRRPKRSASAFSGEPSTRTTLAAAFVRTAAIAGSADRGNDTAFASAVSRPAPRAASTSRDSPCTTHSAA